MADGGTPELKIKLQIYCGEEIAMGPGKADLLDAIAAAGSISAGARTIGMSYRRAWLLVDTMNRCWKEPLIETAPGGQARAGARITPFGREVLAGYRALQQHASSVHGEVSWSNLQRGLRGASSKDSR
jgi:molybdate transport system regulatory protein